MHGLRKLRVLVTPQLCWLQCAFRFLHYPGYFADRGPSALAGSAVRISSRRPITVHRITPEN